MSIGRKRIFVSIVSLFLLLNFAAGCESKPQNEEIKDVDAEYLELTTGGINAPFDVRFGKVKEKERKLYKDLNLLVIDTDFGDADDIKALHENKNKRVLVYINVGALDTNFVTDGRFDDLKLGEYEGWDGEFWVDIRNRRWKDFIYEQAQEIVKLGADGFFVDNLDVYGNYSEKDGMFDAALEILSHLADLKNDIVINGGDEFVTKAMNDGVLDKTVFSVNQEDVFTDKGAMRADGETFKYYMDYLKKCKKYGLDVYLIEYGTFGQEELEEISKKCEENGFTYYVSPSIYLDKKWSLYFNGKE